MNQPKHKHHIDVQTDDELVTVTIGNDGGVPGGFAKLFNRIVDSEAWAKLSDAARAVYVPLVRFADHRNQFRVQLGRAGMMKYAGLSQSSIKRAIKELISHKLVVLIEQGGVSAAGENESNVYQLLVPTESRKRAGNESQMSSSVRPGSPIETRQATINNPAGGSVAAPAGVRRRTPAMAPAGPTAGSTSAPPPDPLRTGSGVQADATWGVRDGPQLRTVVKEDSKTTAPPSTTSSAPMLSSRLPMEPMSIEPMSAQHAAALLEDKGVEAGIARQLAQAYPYDRVVDVVATMEYRKARGKCDNPGGFIRDALVKQWQTPRAVTDARAKAEARLKAEAAESQARANAQREVAQVSNEEARIDRLIASLDDDDLTFLARNIIEKYQGNAAVTAILTRKPPRECRLMKMEIAAMMDQGKSRV